MEADDKVDLDEIERTNEYLKRAATSTAFRYATLLMDKMWEGSKLVPAEDLAIYGYPGQRGELVRVYEGGIQLAGDAVGLSRSAVGAAQGLLNAMLCSTTLRKSTPARPSLVLLSYKPTAEHFEEFKSNISLLSRRITPNKYEEMRKKIEDLEDRVNKLEKAARQTADALVKLEDRRMLGGD